MNKTLSKIIKFAALGIFCAFGVLLANYYYQFKDSADKLFSELAITVFMDKACKDGAEVRGAIEKLGFVRVGEYVPSDQAYAKAAEKNPFLKEISVPGDAGAFQSYVKIFPSQAPDDPYLASVLDAVSRIEGVDEIVFDSKLFKKYADMENVLYFYGIASAVFVLAVFMLFIMRSIIFAVEKEENTRKLVANIAAYLAAASAGFLGLWSACVFMQFPLFIGRGQAAVFMIIMLTAALGVVFKN